VFDASDRLVGAYDHDDIIFCDISGSEVTGHFGGVLPTCAASQSCAVCGDSGGAPGDVPACREDQAGGSGGAVVR
jgi:hypothetical protein